MLVSDDSTHAFTERGMDCLQCIVCTRAETMTIRDKDTLYVLKATPPHWLNSEILLVWWEEQDKYYYGDRSKCSVWFNMCLTSLTNTFNRARVQTRLAVHSHNTESTAVRFISWGCAQNQNGLANSDSPFWSSVILNKPLQFCTSLHKTLTSY